MRSFAYHRATSLAEAMVEAGDMLLAGGTTVVDLVKLDVLQPSRLVDINRLALDQIARQADGGWLVGANVRNSALAWHPELRSQYPVIAEALLAGASAQIRNMATTAGNLRQRVRCPYYRDTVSACNKREPGSGCAALEGYNRMHAVLGGSEACIATHPSDLCVALAAVEAVVIVLGPTGEREIPFEDFHLLPGSTPEREHALRDRELITAVRLPPLPAGARSHYLKVRDRESYEFALASAAVVVHLDGQVIAEARVALGGVGTKPWRAQRAEEVLRGAPATPETFRAAAEAALRDAQPRHHNAFKIPLARRTLERALAEATAPAA